MQEQLKQGELPCSREKVPDGLETCHMVNVIVVVIRVGRAAEKLEDAAFELIRVATVVEATSQPMPKRDPLRSYMDKIYAQV